MRITAADYLLTPAVEELPGPTLPDLFVKTATKDPAKVAVTDGEQVWTWSQWHADANALAKALQDDGVGPGDVVAVQLANSWEFLTLHVALAFVGAVMLPLHVAYSRSDVEAVLSRAQPTKVVDAAGWKRLYAAGSGGSPRPVAVTPVMPFMALPSSGTSSAQPKICLHSHGSLLTNAVNLAKTGSLTSHDVALSGSPFSHLFGLHLIHQCLLAGARLVLMPRWDAEECLRLAEKERVSILYAVPTQLHEVVSRLGGRQLSGIRTVRTAGAAVPSELVSEIRAALTDRVLVSWGMSEVGCGTSTGWDDPADVASATVGRPLEGARMRVVEGELQFRSTTMFHGYLSEPELTRDAFTQDGWLRTGDLGRIDPDGRVVYLGRSGDVINVGGRKVMVRELEDLLVRYGRIAVIGAPDDLLGEYPCVVTEDRQLTLDTVLSTLRAAGLSQYKLPLDLVAVDAIPLTPTGKISRKRVSDLVTACHDSHRGGLREHKDILQIVLECATRAVGAGELIAADADLHDVGLDSAASVRFRNDLARNLGRAVPVAVVFDHPTPKELAEHLATAVENTPRGSFEQVYRQLCRKAPQAAAEMIRAAAVLRPVFAAGDEVAPHVVDLAKGPGATVVVCLSSMLPMTTPTKFTEFARALADRADAYGIAHPGFSDGEPVPCDADALAAAHIATITRLVGDRPYLLCGYSSGGWIAHMIAERLCLSPSGISRNLRALVLLDTAWPSANNSKERSADALAGSVRREEALGIEEVGLTRLTATGAYLRLLDEWAPATVGVPVLHVAAEIGGTTWQQSHVAARAAGDHLTMLPAAGHVVAAWARDLERQS